MQEKSQRDSIIENLFTGKNFCGFIAKIEPAHLQDDLKQEAALILCEMPDEKIIGLHERKELSFYMVRSIFNMVGNKYHPFHKKYRGVNLEYKEILTGALDTSVFYDYDLDSRDDGSKADKLNRMEIEENGAFAEADRESKEQLEDFAIEEINNLYWFDRDMLKVYLEVGTYRGMFEKTLIPFPTCYKNIQKSIAILRKRALAPKAVFTKDELNFIQNNTHEAD